MRAIVRHPLALWRRQAAPFSGGHASAKDHAHEHAQEHAHGAVPEEPDIVEETIVNPDRLRDLRGYEYLKEIEEEQQQRLHIQYKKPSKWRFYNLPRLLPEKVIHWAISLTNPADTAVPSDDLHFPKIYENGVPLYDSWMYAGLISAVKKTWMLAFCSTVTTVLPLASFLTTSILYLMFKTYFQRYYDVVYKMEIVPEMKEIAYQKLDFWGRITTYRVKINDLVFEPIPINRHNDENPHERSNRPIVNTGLTFKIKSSGEYLRFEKHGFWHETGVNHPYLI